MIKIAFMKILALFAVVFTFTALAFSYAHAGGGWTGFYAGGSAGYAWGTSSNTLSIADGPTLATCHFCFASDITSVESSGSPSVDPKGFTGGAQIGYNWQASNLVYGAELDFEAFSQRQTANSSFTLATASAPANSYLWLRNNLYWQFLDVGQNRLAYYNSTAHWLRLGKYVNLCNGWSCAHAVVAFTVIQRQYKFWRRYGWQLVGIVIADKGRLGHRWRIGASDRGSLVVKSGISLHAF